MANPEHVAELDGLDRFTVRLYRAGLALAATALLGGAVALHLSQGAQEARIVGLIGVCTGLSAWNLHLYDKRFRWFMGGLAWTGLMGISAAVTVLPEDLARIPMLAGLGFCLAAVSSMALKEWFCFRLPVVRSAPLFLAACLIPWVGQQWTAAAVLLGIGGLMVALLAFGKLTMPLHYDIGDKSRYQV